MGYSLVSWLLGAAAAVVAAGWIGYIRWTQFVGQGIWRDEFFAAAGRLIDDPATPEHVIDDLRILARLLPSRTALWGYVRRALLGKVEEQATLWEEYASLPEHLREDFIQAWTSVALGTTYNNMILGALARRLIFAGIQRSKPSPASIGSVGPMVDEFTHHGAAARA